jgi:hypothetical protein
MVYNGKFLLKWMIQRYPHGLETSMCSPEIANGFTNPGPSQAQGHRPPSLLRVIQALSHCIPISANRNCIKISRGKYSVFQWEIALMYKPLRYLTFKNHGLKIPGFVWEAMRYTVPSVINGFGTMMTHQIGGILHWPTWVYKIMTNIPIEIIGFHIVIPWLLVNHHIPMISQFLSNCPGPASAAIGPPHAAAKQFEFLRREVRLRHPRIVTAFRALFLGQSVC